MADRNKYLYHTCYAVMGNLTSAQKAQKVLAAAAIPSSVGKIGGGSMHKGCAWSVNFSCNQMQNVRTVLASAGINVRAWEDANDIL